jgi:CHAT domain-containing protein
MIEYLVSDSETLVFVITRDTLKTIELDVGRPQLETLVDFLRGTIVRPRAVATADRGPQQPAWRAPLRRLHQHLVAPLEAAGALAGIRRLILVPHVELHYLPFAALIRAGDARPGARDEFLVERYEVGYAPSASAWVRLSQRKLIRRENSNRILALAPRTGALPGSAQEVGAIQSLYGSRATVLKGSAASESAFIASAPTYGILHLATYGVLNKHNPLFSFVTMNASGEEDGRLEVHEVFGLSLNAQLLVLSACQTALGSGAVSDVPVGDDWVGLVRAFLSAGVSNVVATLWPIEDRSTAQVMERLYRRLSAGEPVISATAAAQRESLASAATADPFYWAAFVLIGGR